MSGGGDVIGDIAQGALTARALEPTHGEAAQTEAGDAGHTHESACLNCGTPLVGTHCHACGQAAHVHRTIRAFFHDLLHGVFHFEGKIWRTLPLLAWKPGLLTREYIDGRRASYVSPIALFLFVVFLTFAVFNALGSPVTFTTPSGKAGSPSESLRAGFAEAERQTQGELERLEARLAVARKSDPGMVAELEGDVADTRATLETLRGSKAARLPGTVSLGDTPQERALSERFQRVVAHARENPELLIYKLQNSAYKFSWMLIPLSVPFLWLLFPFSQRFHLYDHTVS